MGGKESLLAHLQNVRHCREERDRNCSMQKIRRRDLLGGRQHKRWQFEGALPMLSSLLEGQSPAEVGGRMTRIRRELH